MKFKTKLCTNGSGLWSNVVRKVETTKLTLGYLNDENTFGELRVYFTKKSWDVDKHGLIYTDRQFLLDLRTTLMKKGFSKRAVMAVGYSEQGMQGKNYVSCDITKPFLSEFLEDLNGD